MEQNWSEEDAQAMEQWLRRIPDDPGGLLRRKFRNQHERRGARKVMTLINRAVFSARSW